MARLPRIWDHIVNVENRNERIHCINEPMSDTLLAE